MDSKVTFFQPKYVKNFICDGRQCGAKCCKSWIIDVDKDTFAKYQKIESPAKEISSKFKFFEERNSYVVLLDENYSCMLLTDDNLCWLQKNYGPSYLSITCQTFPRSTYNLIDFFERALMLSCPVAAKLALLPTDPMEFEFIETVMPLDTKFSIRNNHAPTEILPHLMSIQLTATVILQERSLTLDQRLAILGFFLDRLDEVVTAKNFGEIYNLAEIYTSEKFFTQTVPALLSDLNFNVKDFVKVMFGGVLENLYVKSKLDTGFDIMTASVLEEVFKFTSSLDIAEKNFLDVNNLRGEFVKQFNVIFENYLVNEFFINLYPFSVKNSIRHNYAVFIATYKIMELFTFAIMKKFSSISEGDLIRTIPYMTENIDHTPPYIEKISAALEGIDDTLKIISTFLQVKEC